MSKYIKLSADDRKALGTGIVDGWLEDNTDRTVWLQDLSKWLDAYQGRPVQKDLPWEGASNFFVPATETVINATQPRLFAALFKPRPIVSFQPQEPSDIERVNKWETFLDYAVREELNLAPLMDRVLLNTLIYGVQVVKSYWEVETKNIRDEHEFPLGTDPITAITAILEGESLYAEAVNRVTDQSYEATFGDRKVTIEVAETPRHFVVYTEREEVTRDAPVVELVNPEDFTVNADCPYNIQKADHVYHRYWLTLDRAKKLAKRGSFTLTDDDLEELERLASGEIDTDDNSTLVKMKKEEITGVNETTKEGPPYQKLEVIDAYMPYDVNNDGYDEDVIVTVFKQAPHIVARVCRLETVFRHGLKPFVLFYANPVADSIWARGLSQTVDGIQQELNTIHNQRVDAGEIGNTPFGWYQPQASMPKEPLPLRPGFLNPVQDVNQVKMHIPANYTAWGFQEEQQLITFLERLTKVSDITIGRLGESQGAARTATGVNVLNQQQASGFDIVIRRIQEGWKQLLQQILALYRQYMPPMKYVRVLGSRDQEPIAITREDLTGHLDMVFTGNALSTDREVERNTTTFLAQTVFSPNALQFLLQLGILNPQGIAEWYRHLLTVFDVQNFERIITVPKQPRIETPESTIQSILAGVDVVPKQGEDHNAIIMEITRLLDSPDAMGIAAEVRMLFLNQIRLRQVQAANEQAQAALQQLVMQQLAPPGPPAGMPMLPGMGGAPVPLPGTQPRAVY